MPKFEFEFDPSDFEAGLERLVGMTIKNLQDSVFATAEALRGDSTDIAPFDKGFAGGLVSTARTSVAKVRGTEVESEVTYNKEYAVKVHEDMSLNIVQRNTVKGQRRQQKYLEKPMKENAKDYGKIMSLALSEILK